MDVRRFSLMVPSRLYSLILGNPPYGRSANGCLQVMFTAKAFRRWRPGRDGHGGARGLLSSDSDSQLTRRMLKDGHFTHIWMSHDEDCSRVLAWTPWCFATQGHTGAVDLG